MNIVGCIGLALVALNGCGGDDGGNCTCDVTINGEHAVIACGSSDCVGGRTQMCDDSANLTEGATCGGSSTFDCNGETCQTSTQYCLDTYTGSAQTTSACTMLPAGCTTCSCAQTDAPTHFPTSNNCSGGATISCSSTNGEITVSCLR